MDAVETVEVTDISGSEEIFGEDGKPFSYKFDTLTGISVLQIFDGLNATGNVLAIFVNPARVRIHFKEVK